MSLLLLLEKTQEHSWFCLILTMKQDAMSLHDQFHTKPLLKNYKQSLFFIRYFFPVWPWTCFHLGLLSARIIKIYYPIKLLQFFSAEHLIKVRTLHIWIHYLVTCTVKGIIVIIQRCFAWLICNKHQFTLYFHIFIMYAHMCAYAFPHPCIHVFFLFLISPRGLISRCYPWDPWFLPLPSPSLSLILVAKDLGGHLFISVTWLT